MKVKIQPLGKNKTLNKPVTKERERLPTANLRVIELGKNLI